MSEQNGRKRVIYAVDQTPPARILFLAGLQHMLLVLSLSLALPLTVARSIGLSTSQSSSFLATTLFFMAVATALQSSKVKWLGSGFQSASTADSAAISPCILAAEAGGMPLVWGMTAFSGAVRFVLSFGTRTLKRLFPPEVTGCSIFILGISLVPTTMKNFLGTTVAPEMRSTCIIVAALSFLAMLIFAVLLPKFRLYAVLTGIAVGYALSFAFGVINPQDFHAVAELPAFALPLPSNLSLAFSPDMILPFLIISLANVIDNIGDFSAAQSAAVEKLDKPNWTSIANGSRASAFSTMAAGLLGGGMMSTATGNIGVTRATGVASRRVAYVTAALLAICAFLPGVTGILSVMPQPVLGAILLYSACYIMAGGFETLTSNMLDDRRVFTVFVSVIAAMSALIPGLYDFLPDMVRTLLISPVTLGVTVLIAMSALMSIGRRKSFTCTLAATAESTARVDEVIEKACAHWCAPRKIYQKLKIGVSALLEGIEEQAPGAPVDVKISYDEARIAFHADCKRELACAQDASATLSVALMMLRGMFSTVRVNNAKARFTVDIEEEL